MVIVPFGFLLDPVSLLMLCIVATIAWLIQIYSIGYMEGDPGFGRFYADLSLFGMAMLSLVIVPAACCNYSSPGSWWAWPPIC